MIYATYRVHIHDIQCSYTRYLESIYMAKHLQAQVSKCWPLWQPCGVAVPQPTVSTAGSTLQGSKMYSFPLLQQLVTHPHPSHAPRNRSMTKPRPRQGHLLPLLLQQKGSKSFESCCCQQNVPVTRPEQVTYFVKWLAQCAETVT